MPFSGDLGDGEALRDGGRRPHPQAQINARRFFQTIAEIQFESANFTLFEDMVNKANLIKGRITMSNLCSEILQGVRGPTYNGDLSY